MVVYILLKLPLDKQKVRDYTGIMIKEKTGGRYRIGPTGERYITFSKKLKRYIILISVGKGTQRYVGHFLNLHEAITARDKYLTELL